MTIAKLYTGAWADRLSTWAEGADILSTAQKGFRSFDGVIEHNLMIQCAINEARERGREVHIAFIDLQNAFCSVPHSLIRSVLERSGVPPEF